MPKSRDPLDPSPPCPATTGLARFDHAEQMRHRVRLAAGEQSCADADRRQGSKDHAGAGELTAVLALHRGPYLPVDDRAHSVGLSGELLRLYRRKERDLYARRPDNRWLLSSSDSCDDFLHLESIEVRLKLADLYEKVELPA